MKNVKISLLVLLAALVLTGASCSRTEEIAPEGTTPDEGASGETQPSDEGEEAGAQTSSQIQVTDQATTGGKVVITSVTSAAPAWVVIHTNDNGNPGEVIGYAAVSAGTTPQVEVTIDVTKQTPILYAMLHEDTGVQGTYEFPAEDKPVTADDGVVVMTAINVITETGAAVTSEMPVLGVTGVTETTVEGAASVSAPEVQSFSIIARKWEFQPGTITVKKGNTVKLSITSLDTTHGFGLSEFGISETIEQGKTAEVEFVADKVGEFSFACTVFCGEGHGGMKGTLVVTE